MVHDQAHRWQVPPAGGDGATGVPVAAQASSNITYGLGDVCSLLTAGISSTSTQPVGSVFALNASASCAFSGTAEYRYSRRERGLTECWGDLEDVVDATPTNKHACAIRADNSQVECWGSNNWDVGMVSEAPEGVAFTQVSAGEYASCGIRAEDNTLTCWGELHWNPR